MTRQSKTAAAPLLTAACLALIAAPPAALAADAADAAQAPAADAGGNAAPAACPVSRRAINFNRWNEDWQALATPCRARRWTTSNICRCRTTA